MNKPLSIFKASAGSGKTYSLVKEYLKIALGPGDPNYFRHILAITFTNKAAAEMKTRVFEFLEELRKGDAKSELKDDLMHALNISEGQLTQRANEMLRAMMYNYSDIGISTIDSFVLEIVKGFSRELGLTYQFELELDEDKILIHAIDRMIEGSKQSEFLTHTLNQFVIHRISEETSWSFVDELKFFCKHLLKDKSRKYIQQLAGLSDEALENARIKILENRDSSKAQTLAIASTLKSFIRSLGIELDDFYKGKTGQFYRIEKILAGTSLEKIETDYARYDKVSGDQWFAKGNDKEERIEPHKPKIRKDIQDLLGHLEDYNTWQAKINSIFPMMLISNVARAIEEIKTEEEKLLISDSHRLIHQIVQDNPVPFVYERLGERYKHFMIDEFQDTSVTQFHNLIPLIENSVSQNYQNVIVGDSKQSIYRFREGESEQIIKLPHQLHRKEELHDGDFKEELIKRTGEEKSLRVNYRSDKEIVLFNNLFFKTISARLADEHPAAESFTGYFQETKSELPGYVQLHPVNKSDHEQESLDHLVKEIQLCISDGFELHDIAILVRDRNKGEKVANHLAQFPNLPFISQDSLKYKSNDELIFIINVLRQHLYKDQLSSGLGILTYLVNRDDPARHYDYALKCCYNENQDAKPHNRFNTDKCLELFNISYSFSSENSFSVLETVHQIIHTFKININNGFIHQLLDEVHVYSAKNGHNLGGFIEYWETTLMNKSIDIPENKNAIRILSIHKSKGLQFPIVFIPFTSWDQNSKREYTWVKGHENDPLPFYLVQDRASLLMTHYREDYVEEQGKRLIDHLNLLYVSFTRAKKRLYITVEERKNSIKELKSNPSNWINYFLQKTNQFEYGDREVIKAEGAQSDELFNIYLAETNWREKLVANYNFYDDYLKFEEVKNKRLDGILIHKVFEQSNNLSSCIELLDQMLNKLEINRIEHDLLTEKFKSIYSKADVSKILGSAGEVKNELVLVDESGRSYRPDRIIFGKNNTHIIDLKTGGHHEGHKDQLNNYQGILKKMGYGHIEKHLIYFNSEEIISWK